MIRLATLAACCALALDASASEETVANYAAAPPHVRKKFSDQMAELLSENHPELSRSKMFMCLESIADYPSIRKVNLKAAAVVCANYPR